MKKVEIEWHKYPDEKPKNNPVEPYLVSIRCFGGTCVDMEYYEDDSFKWMPYKEDKSVIAWAEMPEPYKEEI